MEPTPTIIYHIDIDYIDHQTNKWLSLVTFDVRPTLRLLMDSRYKTYLDAAGTTQADIRRREGRTLEKVFELKVGQSEKRNRSEPVWCDERQEKIKRENGVVSKKSTRLIIWGK